MLFGTAIGDSQYNGSYLATEDGKSFRALFYEAMYTESNDLSMIRLFSWSIKSIRFSPCTDNEGQEFVDAYVEFSDVILLLLPKNEHTKTPKRITMEDAFNDFMERHTNIPHYALSTDEQRLLDMYRGLTDIERAKYLELSIASSTENSDPAKETPFKKQTVMIDHT